jgi:hypothetical protein
MVNQVQSRRSTVIIAILGMYFLGLFLNASWLFPYVNEINYWDEIVYIAAGKDLFDHKALWPYPRGPVISFIYAVIYAFVADTEYWLIVTDAAGRVLAYTLLFISVWLVGRELQLLKLAPALLLLSLFTALPVYSNFINNPSYWTFAVFAGLSLWLILVFARTQKISVLVGASFMVGFTLLARPDVVFGISALLAAVFTIRPWRIFNVTKVVASMAGIPSVLVGGYIAIFGLQTGVYLFGGESKLYDTFASSYQVLFDEKTAVRLLDFEAAAKAREESARVFGTRDENKNSVLRAIARNPSHFALMVWHNTVKRTGSSLKIAYGPRVTPDSQYLAEQPVRYLAFFILFFAILGLIELFRRREWTLLLVLAVWPLDMALYLFTISFPDYFLLHVIIVLLLAAVGLWAGLARLGQWWMLALWAVVLAIVTMLDWNPAGRVVLMAALSGILLGVAYWMRHTLADYRPLTASIVVVGLLIVNLPDVYRFDWPGKDTGYIAQAKHLRDNYPPTTPALAYPGMAVVSAKMWWIGVWADLDKIKSANDFHAAMKLVGMPLIVIDPLLPAHNIYGLNSSIEKYASAYYRLGWSTTDGRYRVLVPKDLSKSKVIPR